MGGLLATKNEVTQVSRHPAAGGSKVPGVAVANYANGLRQAEVVFLAVPHDEVRTVAAQVGGLKGKIVVDLTNPFTTDYLALTVGYTTSGGEQVAALFPDAKVVKAFNTIFAPVLAKAAKGARALPTVLIAGDHRDANEVVQSLAKSMGFSAVITGPLANARYIEPLAELQIQLAYGQGHGAEVGFTYAPVS